MRRTLSLLQGDVEDGAHAADTNDEPTVGRESAEIGGSLAIGWPSNDQNRRIIGHRVAKHWPKSAKHWPSGGQALAKIGEALAKIGEASAKIGQPSLASPPWSPPGSKSLANPQAPRVGSIRA